MNKVALTHKRISMMLFLLIFAMSACQPKEESIPTPIGNIDQVATIVAATLSAYPSVTPEPTQPPIPTEILPKSMTYINESYGFAFEYPSTWNVAETIVPMGTHLFQRSFNRFDAGSDDYDTLIVEASKGSEWILEIVASKAIQNCGGYSSDLIGSPSDIQYQSLEVLGRNALRLRPEDGYAWQAPDAREPYPVLVVFPNDRGECPNDANDWMLFGISNNQIPVTFYITYYSSQFTKANLQNRTVDNDDILILQRKVRRESC
jgi:hypothetical protein